MATATVHSLVGEVEYPHTDGRPIAEADPHRREMTYLTAAPGHHFRSRSDVYVSGDLLPYSQRGDPRQCVAPDLFVELGQRLPTT